MHDQATLRRDRTLGSLAIAALFALALGPAPPATAGGTPETTIWSVFGSTSSVNLIGSEPALDDQDVETAAALAPADWRTIDSIDFPRINFGLGEFVDLTQGDPATGTFDPATGVMTLTVVVTLVDSDGGDATLTVELTTETASGTDPDGNPVSRQGARRDPVSGALRLVGVEAVPAGSNTTVDLELLVVEIDGEIVPSDIDADGLQSFVDNCPSDANAGQQDEDLDALGDPCDSCTDVDRDGFGAPGDDSCSRGDGTDCDDDDDTAFPGGPEFCDDADNDCDAAADEALCSEFDVNADSFVDGVELAWLGRAFGSCSSNVEWWSAIDLFADGCIDGDDLALLTVVWDCAAGPICP